MGTDPQRARRYHSVKLSIGLVVTALGIAYAVSWIVWDIPSLLGWPASRWVGLLVVAGVYAAGFELLTLPIAYFTDYVLEHRYGLSQQTHRRWLTQNAKGWLVGALLGGVLLCGFYALLWYGGSWWWAWVAAAWIGFTVVLAQLAPVLLLPIFFKSDPLDDPGLAERLQRLAAGTSLRVEGLYRLTLSDDTRAANAMLTGLGRTRRVYFSDTLLSEFTPEEIEVVFAHELGHHTRGHIWKLLGAGAAMGGLLIAGWWWVLEPLREGPWTAAVAALPRLMLVSTAVDLIVKPFHNALSRRFERQCDSDALRRTGHAAAYRSAFERLATMNLADPQPPAWIEWYFHDHPAMASRIAMADRDDMGV